MNSNPRRVLVAEDHLAMAGVIQFALRKAGLAVEMYPGQAKLGAQFKYADRKGIPLVIVGGKKELEQDSVNVKHLESGEQHDGIAIGELLRLDDVCRVTALRGRSQFCTGARYWRSGQ